MAAAKGNLRPRGEIEEFGIVNSHCHASLTAAQIATDVATHSEPAAKVVGDTRTRAPRIRFQGTARREHSSRKQSVYFGIGIEEGVSAVELPFRSGLFLRRCAHGNTAPGSDYCQQRKCNTTTRVKRMRCHVPIPPKFDNVKSC